MDKVCILDYGSGNTKSVYNLFASISTNVFISNAIIDINDASHIVLPGVGSFKSSMTKIIETIPMDTLRENLFKKGKPFLGICVGMQVLADIGQEFEETNGLGWVSGEVKRLECNSLPLPHVGWNSVNIAKTSFLFRDIEDGSDFYFVHSYAFRPVDRNCIISNTIYGETFCSALEYDNFYGVQFHPEKSHVAGRKLVNNFLSIT